MLELHNKKEIRTLGLLLGMVYMISYVTRINFGAIISEMERTTGISRSLLSMSVTGSFIAYGAGQIISGILGDKFSPKKLISLGFCLTILTNLLIPVCTSPYAMLVIWCVNGFAQSLMWPPMVRIMTAMLSPKDYQDTVVTVSCGSSIGSIVVYLLAPVLIAVFSWKAVFWICAGCGAVMLLIWQRFGYDVPVQKIEAKQQKSKQQYPALFSPMMLSIMAAIVLQGMLKDGVTTWMPSYISETYNLSSAISILTGVCLPLFSIVCYNLSSRLYGTVFQNPITCAGAFFAVGTGSALGVYLLSGANAALSVLFSALLTGTMHGANLMLVAMVPARFKANGNISTISGVVNACTYIGSAISTYGIALVSEMAGWSTTLLLWIAIAGLGMLLCFAIVKPWKRSEVKTES